MHASPLRQGLHIFFPGLAQDCSDLCIVKDGNWDLINMAHEQSPGHMVREGEKKVTVRH